jgi:hypothetical protein
MKLGMKFYCEFETMIIEEKIKIKKIKNIYIYIARTKASKNQYKNKLQNIKCKVDVGHEKALVVTMF